MPPGEPTDRQVRADVYRIARAYLEVERGLRQPEHLERFLTPAEYRRHRKRPPAPRTRTGEAVLPTDIGRIHIDRNLPGQITASLATRENEDHWGALVLHFARNHTGRWAIDQLERLTRPSVARQSTRQPAGYADLGERIRHIEEELQLVEAAHRATTTRLTELRKSARQSDVEKQKARELRQQQRTWKRRREELDHELDQLRARHRLRQHLADLDRHHELDPTQLSGAQLEQLLGPVPADTWRQQLRAGVVEEIHAYRRRWKVTDPRSILGPIPVDPDHRGDRNELAHTLRASARALGSSAPAREGAAITKRAERDQPGIAAER